MDTFFLFKEYISEEYTDEMQALIDELGLHLVSLVPKTPSQLKVTCSVNF
jgi:hypothetical protein